MDQQQLFSGRAIAAVDADGRFILPGFIADTLDRRGERGRICFGVHERDTCLQGYDERHHCALFADIERRRLADEAAGRNGADHYSRLRRMFGFVEQAEVAADGSIVLPALLRRKAMIRRAALIVGAGPCFEIWNPRIARDAADPQIRELADLRVQNPAQEEREVMA